jgi:hypothetical protein
LDLSASFNNSTIGKSINHNINMSRPLYKIKNSIMPVIMARMAKHAGIATI